MRPLWLLASPRTGSGVLTEYLNRTRCFDPGFTEWLNPDNWSHEYMTSSPNPMHARVPWQPWKEITESDPEKLCSKLPPFNKLQKIQFNFFLGPKSKSLIHASLPGIRYILVRRRDLVATAVSQYIAAVCSRLVPQYSGLSAYHVEDVYRLKMYEMTNLPVDCNKLMKCYVTALRQNTEWDEFLSTEDEVLEVYFEDFIDGEVVKVCEFAGVRPVSFPLDQFSTLPIKHPQKEMLTDVLLELLEQEDNLKILPGRQPLML